MGSDDRFCGICGAPAAPPAPEAAEASAVGRRSAATPPVPEDTVEQGQDGSRRNDADLLPTSDVAIRWRHKTRWAVGGAVIAAITFIALAIAGSEEGSDPDRGAFDETPTSTTLVTQYGCEIRDLDVSGIEATEVFPPYCTDVHVIEDYCALSADHIIVPPFNPVPGVRIYESSTEVGQGRIDFELRGSIHDRVVVTCSAVGRGPVTHSFGLEEWNRFNDPVDG